MSAIELSGLIVEPLAQRLRAWCSAGKLEEDDLERALSQDARAWIDHSISTGDWVAIEDVEGLVAIAADQLGGETGLVDWADELVADWLLEGAVTDLTTAGEGLVDGPGFVVSQASTLLIRGGGWSYEGGARAFQVQLRGLETASVALASLLGACLARLAEAVDLGALDVRFEGVDGDDLVVFGEVGPVDMGLAESRLHRAALVP